MKKLITTLSAAALLSASVSAFADDMNTNATMGTHTSSSSNMNMNMDMMKMADANGDGMVSKTEYMNHASQMWKNMKKDKKGMVMLNDMQMDNMSGDRMNQ